MKAIPTVRYEGENLGPIDWNYDFAKYGRGGDVERLRQLMSGGEWEATTDGGWPRCGWGRVLDIGMYDGWPHWSPTPSVYITSWMGGSWHPYYSLTDIRKVEAVKR
jgi:hypothetical protein